MSQSKPNRKKNQYTYEYNRQLPQDYRYGEYQYNNRPSWMDERDEEVDKEYVPKSKKEVKARTQNQQIYIDILDDKDEFGNNINEFIYCSGPAGSGKTHVAVGIGVKKLRNKEVDKIVLVRPMVTVDGEDIGFLPGDEKEKIDPYLRPLYDELEYFYKKEDIEKMIKNDVIQIAPLCFLRGRTLKNAYVILDEAQNATKPQMKMFVTRMGEGSIFLINGDPAQSDLFPELQGTFMEYALKYGEIDGIAYCKLNKNDIVRHRLVQAMIELGMD